jgi:hypothetical protein
MMHIELKDGLPAEPRELPEEALRANVDIALLETVQDIGKLPVVAQMKLKGSAQDGVPVQIERTNTVVTSNGEIKVHHLSGFVQNPDEERPTVAVKIDAFPRSLWKRIWDKMSGNDSPQAPGKVHLVDY